jgi:hypothetical protein
MTRPTILLCICSQGNIFTAPLPISDMGIYIQTERLMGGFMKYIVEMDSSAMIYTVYSRI